MIYNPKCSLVEIKWLDHCHQGDGWNNTCDIEPAPITTVGYVLKDEQMYYVLGSQLCDPEGGWNQFHQKMLILKSTIQQIKVLNG